MQNQWHITHLPQSWHSSASLEHGSFQQDSHFQPRMHPQTTNLQITSLFGYTPGKTRWLSVVSMLLKNKTKGKMKTLCIHFHFQGPVKSYQILVAKELLSVLSLT